MFELLERTGASGASNAESEEQTQAPMSADAGRVLQETQRLTTASSACSSTESFNVFLADIDALVETLDILSDPELVSSLRQGLRESAEGKGQDLDDVLAELGW